MEFPPFWSYEILHSSMKAFDQILEHACVTLCQLWQNRSSTNVGQEGLAQNQLIKPAPYWLCALEQETVNHCSEIMKVASGCHVLICSVLMSAAWCEWHWNSLCWIKLWKKSFHIPNSSASLLCEHNGHGVYSVD